MIYISCHAHLYPHSRMPRLLIEILTRTRYYADKCEDISFKYVECITRIEFYRIKFTSGTKTKVIKERGKEIAAYVDPY